MRPSLCDRGHVPPPRSCPRSARGSWRRRVVYECPPVQTQKSVRVTQHVNVADDRQRSPDPSQPSSVRRSDAHPCHGAPCLFRVGVRPRAGGAAGAGRGWGPAAPHSMNGATFTPQHSCLCIHAALLLQHSRRHIFSPLSGGCHATALVLLLMPQHFGRSIHAAALTRLHFHRHIYAGVAQPSRTSAFTLQLSHHRCAGGRGLFGAHLPTLSTMPAGLSWGGGRGLVCVCVMFASENGRWGGYCGCCIGTYPPKKCVIEE